MTSEVAVAEMIGSVPEPGVPIVPFFDLGWRGVLAEQTQRRQRDISQATIKFMNDHQDRSIVLYYQMERQ
jgi:hypothetical protein